jgi:hypothetical protein
MLRLKTFKEFTEFSESFDNLLKGRHDEKRIKAAPELFQMLLKSYKRIGGLKGKGFKSVEDMIENIPFWKIIRKQNKPVAAILYKDKDGRKAVAMATNGSRAGLLAITKAFQDDVLQERAYLEISGAGLSFNKKRLPADMTIADVAIEFKNVKKLIPGATRPSDGDAEVSAHPELKDFFYSRNIAGEQHTKIMLGAPYKNLI